MNKNILADKIINSLRQGLPPRKGTNLYSVGYDKLIDGIKNNHLSKIDQSGKIRFISGSWGAGKTHFFRLLREITFENNCLVSNVELNVNEAPLNKFEKVFYSIIRNVSTPSQYKDSIDSTIPFANVVYEALRTLGESNGEEITHEEFDRACHKLMSDKGIDIDFKKIIQEYWKTYFSESADAVLIEQTRDELIQWFTGEGKRSEYSRKFGVNKMVSKENAKLLLQSLTEFIKLAGYKGLVILFDEAEQSFSVMRRSALRDAHNNLLSLINNISDLNGLFLIYATTPDFYNDPKHGIIIYGALAQRIGQPEDKPPRSLQTVWNLDEINMDLTLYQEAAQKIRDLYIKTSPEFNDSLFNNEKTKDFVKELYDEHPQYSPVRFWRVLVTGLIKKLDALLEGEDLSTSEIHKDVMHQLKEN